MKKFTIGQLARETGIKVGTIRYYEKCGLISKPPRRESGYREFTQKHIGQINFIKEAKAKGFTLKEISKLYKLVEEKSTKRRIHKFIEAKIQNINTHISNLQRAQDSLLLTLKECSSTRSIHECPLCKLIKS